MCSDHVEMLDELAGHGVAPESFRRREVDEEMFKAAAAGNYGHMHLYSTFFLPLLVCFLLYGYSFPAHNTSCQFFDKFSLFIACIHYSANFSFTQLTSCFQLTLSYSSAFFLL